METGFETREAVRKVLLVKAVHEMNFQKNESGYQHIINKYIKISKPILQIISD